MIYDALGNEHVAAIYKIRAHFRLPQIRPELIRSLLKSLINRKK
jgi:hypothetical protein